MKRHRINILALWLQPEIGLEGYIGAILADKTPVALCSYEKWMMGPSDSLRENWENNMRIGFKSFYADYSETELKEYGLGNGELRLTVPQVLKILLT